MQAGNPKYLSLQLLQVNPLMFPRQLHWRAVLHAIPFDPLVLQLHAIDMAMLKVNHLLKYYKQGRPPQEPEKGAVRCSRQASSHYVV